MFKDNVQAQSSMICEHAFECPLCGTVNDYYGPEANSHECIIDLWCLQGDARRVSRGGQEHYLLEPRQHNAILHFPVKVVSGTVEFEVAFQKKPTDKETHLIGFSDHAWGDVLSFFVSDGKINTIAKGRDHQVMEPVNSFDFTRKNVLSIHRGNGSCTFFVNGERVVEHEDPCPNKPLYVGVIAEKGNWKNRLSVSRGHWSPGT